MNHIQRGISVFTLVFVAAVVALPAAGDEIVAFQAGPSGLTWRPLVPFEHGILTVATPDGLVFREEFGAGGAVSFSPFQRSGYQPPDGTYIWEVVLGRPSTVPQALRAAAEAARGDGNPDEAEAAHRAASTRATLVQSGAFQVVKGAIVPSNLAEPRKAPRRSRPRSAVPDPLRQAEWLFDDPSIGLADQVIPDDLIVEGSLCVGFDCVNNESFGFDTIRLKENNLRIKFDDTSTASGFSANDWQLTANDSASGGASKFSIEDITGARVPFTVRAGAPTNSLFVDSSGRLGLRTATPVLDVHIATGDTPATRLEQNSAGGFGAQTWDIAGNEANFFVRDVTSGSRLPFRIRPGAPTSSIDISVSGNVGMGTAAPSRNLEVVGAAVLNGPSRETLVLTDTTAAAAGVGGGIVFAGKFAAAGTIAAQFASINGIKENGTDNNFATAMTFFTRANGGNPAERMRISSAGNVGIGTPSPTNPLQMASGAFVSAAGVWTNASSRTLKQDVRELTAVEARLALEQLAPVRYTSTIDPSERHVGFIAEDVPDLVATKDRKTLSPMDIVAVLTRVVQEQEKTIAELAAKLAALETTRARW